MTPPVREFKRFAVEMKADGTAEGRITAYASVFGNVDSYGDRMMPGAFTDSLSTYGLPMLSWEHAWSAGPMGDVLDASEDSHGLKYNAQLYMDSDLPSRVFRAVKARNVKQNSFAFVTEEANTVTEDGKDIREVKKVQLPEVAIVVMGANPATSMVDARGLGFPPFSLEEMAKAAARLGEAAAASTLIVPKAEDPAVVAERRARAERLREWDRIWTP